MIRHICVRAEIAPTTAITVGGEEITAVSATWTLELRPDEQQATLRTALTTADGRSSVAIRVVPMTDWPKWPSRRPQPPTHVEQTARWAMLAAIPEEKS